MIGYVCKYTPVEVFEAMGVEIRRIQPEVTNFNQADTLMHPNICSFTKSVLEDVLAGDYEGVVLTTCCDSIRRLYDVLKQQCPDKFLYLLDVPRKVNDFSTEMYRKNILDMVHAYEAFSGKTFDETVLKQLLKRREAGQNLRTAPKNKASVHIGLMGARCSKGIIDLLENRGVDILFDMTCTGLKREFHVEPDNLLQAYAWQLLNQVPCLRMVKAVNRENYMEGFKDRLDGILYHTVQFCDNYAYEYTNLKQRLDIPLLMVETDATKQCEGQIRTRVEAFIESLKIAKGASIGKKSLKKAEDGKMYVLGIDSGSTSTNAVILNENKEIVAFDVVRTGAKSGESAERILAEILERAGLKREDISLIVSTGYGRVSIPFADENVTEISCHGRGAHYFNPDVRTILDIGGQDSKAIRLNENGEVVDFVMNDKCAAGTGRFLEMMARTMEMSLDQLGNCGIQYKEDITISSMCTVFAESEVVSLIAQNKETDDIVHGLNKAVAAKTAALVKRVGGEEKYMMTGGVSRNQGLVKTLEERLGTKLVISEQAQLCGALGAALFAADMVTQA